MEANKRNFVEWAMHYRQIVILIFSCLVAFGIYSLPGMRKNEFPDFTVRQGIVVAVAPGVPSDEMNRVFLLVHIYRHLMAEGIGLRQLMDYFFLLRKGTDEEARKRFAGQLRELKMMRFAGAVMYVLGRVFGLEERLMPVPPSKKYGGRLLEEIMRAGNFGLYDERIDRSGKDTEWRRFRRRMKRIVRFAADYPDEVCWTPWFKIWHFFWRKAHN